VWRHRYCATRRWSRNAAETCWQWPRTVALDERPSSFIDVIAEGAAEGETPTRRPELAALALLSPIIYSSKHGSGAVT
jgi:hypothetical protein